MSGSFWKFNQDYSTESSLTHILNNAFIRINQKAVETGDEEYSKNKGVLHEEGEKAKGNDDGQDDGQDDVQNLDVGNYDGDDFYKEMKLDLDNGERLPETESEYKDYRPNLDVLEDLLDDEKSYTELICSNFKLMMFFKYPEVLDRLVDYVKNERVIQGTIDSDEEEHADGQVICEEEKSFESKDYGKNISVNSADTRLSELVKENTGFNRQEDDSVNDTSCILTQESIEQTEFRRARMAAEILSADAWPISSTIMDNQYLLLKLWSMLDYPSLSIVSSSYFMKISERLLDMDITAMIRFILSQDNLVDKFLAHIDNPPLMDFLLKIISTDKPGTPTNVIVLLKYQKLISKLLDLLSHEHSSSVKSAAGDFLKALIAISANSNNEIASAIGPNELSRELVSPEMVSKLSDIMLKGGTSLSNGVGIVIELIRKNNSDYDFVQVMYTTLKTHPPTDRDSIYLGHLVKCFADKIPDLKRILVNTKLPELETSFGSIEPLGFERFKICELIAELLHCSNMGLLNEPKGEEIVRKRDVQRQNKLNLDSYGIPDANTYQDEIQTIVSTSSEEDELSDRIKCLNMNSILLKKSDESNENSPDDCKNVSTPIFRLEHETNSDSFSEVELSEQAIREDPVVGDRLKIALHDNEIISTILKMFFEYPWNNFLHNVVFDIVQQIFNGPLKSSYNRFLLADLFVTSRITHSIMEGDQKSEEYEKKTGLRFGYMGHLILVAEEVAKFAAYVDEMKINFKNPVIRESLNDLKWREYTEVVLAETRGKYSTVLGDFIEDYDREYVKMMEKSDDIDSNPYLDNEEENYAEFSEMDVNRYSEYEDETGHTTRIHLDQLDDNDLDEPNTPRNHTTNNNLKNYMSHQLSENYNSVNFSSDEEDDDEDNANRWLSGNKSVHLSSDKLNTSDFVSQVPSGSLSLANQPIFNNQPFELQNHDLGDDNYMDPNDDGQSYAKPHHPLYSRMLSHSHSDNIYFGTNVENIIDVGQESDDSDEDHIFAAEDNIFTDLTKVNPDETEYALYRTSSKDDIKWNTQDLPQTRNIGLSIDMFNRSECFNKDD